jgi:hypothetical protein
MYENRKPYWRRRRIMLNLSMVLWFGCLVYLGQNVILFHRFRGITTADFAPSVNQNMVSAVRAMKEYQREHGVFPDSLFDLYGKDPTREQKMYGGGIHQNQYYHATEFGFIRYDFSPGDEGWYVDGPFARGRIPVPPVTLSPPPATHP